MAAQPLSSAVRALQLELKKLTEEPVEGFVVNVPDECNLFEWDVAIFGPPGTLYEGGYFKVSEKSNGVEFSKKKTQGLLIFHDFAAFRHICPFLQGTLTHLQLFDSSLRCGIQIYTR